MSTPGRGADNLVKQLTAAWEEAQSQLRELRRRVEATAQMARAQLDAQTFSKDRDRALRDLGEAYWKEYQAGRVPAVGRMAAILDRVAKAEQKVAASSASITNLLQDTETPVPPPGAKPPTRKR